MISIMKYNKGVTIVSAEKDLYKYSIYIYMYTQYTISL